MAWRLGLSIGKTFAELTATEGSESISHKWMLTDAAVGDGLAQFFKKHPINVDGLYIYSKYPDKLFERVQSQQVAQIVTWGFEDWVMIRQPISYRNFSFRPQKYETVVSRDNTFGILERVNARGEVLQSIQEEDLHFIASKLSLMDVNRIAITFLHSNANPANELAASEYFEGKGFKTFCSHSFSTTFDEAKRWNSCLLNLCLSEHFEKIKDEIFSHSFKNIPIEDIFFVNSKGDFFQDSTEWALSSLYSQIFLTKNYVSHHIEKNFAHSNYGILYLGLEDFIMIDPSQTNKEISSYLGALDLENPRHEVIKTQPTSELQISRWGDLVFSKKGLGYDPLPLSFEEGKKLTLIDVILNLPDRDSFIPDLLKDKRDPNSSYGEELLKMMKQSQSWCNIESLSTASESLFQFAVKKMFLECHIGGRFDKIILVGPLAKLVQSYAEPMGLGSRFHLLNIDQNYMDSKSILKLVQSKMEIEE